MTEPTSVYRFFGEEGLLLYVGISNNVPRRITEHAKTKPWWFSVARVDVEHYRTRAEAEEAELAAIQGEEPMYNVSGLSGYETWWGYLVRREPRLREVEQRLGRGMNLAELYGVEPCSTLIVDGFRGSGRLPWWPEQDWPGIRKLIDGVVGPNRPHVGPEEAQRLRELGWECTPDEKFLSHPATLQMAISHLERLVPICGEWCEHCGEIAAEIAS